ncbi:radical SAM protein [Eubacterium oxidoreducens]|uniref:Radical SAM superfamily protein n=1 Tax=Eubacterium oxidoreducens TaxID=1732 RepID=A0A1G6B4G1_EUBOX|nr:radical SAM/SPASM domain-containing protein [Eubacterium oxidoreducens]SDB15564.1 Radical SAM superfamily protein [Eubacterium oxidoreducens]
MFTRETYAAEYVEEYVRAHKELFTKHEKLYIYTVCEQAVNLYEILQTMQVQVTAFIDQGKSFLGKQIYGTPVVTIDEVKGDYYIIISSATQALHDQRVLETKGIDKDRTYTLFEKVTRYYSLKNLEIDKKRYEGITKEQNDALSKKELDHKEIEIHAIPTQMIMDLTPRCNLNCRHCEAHHNKEISKIRNLEEDYTPVERYQYLLDYADFIYLNISGEPLMSPRFWDVLDYVDASDNKPELFTVTNGILLDEKAADRIVHSKFERIYISMDGTSDLTYKRLRGGDFGVWKKNVKYLADKRTAEGKKLEIHLHHTVSRESLEETMLAVQLAEELGVDRIVVRPLYEEIAGMETWRVPMDEDREYFYPQQMTTYYPHLTKRIMDEVREFGKTSRVTVDVSDRFDANLDMSVEDIPYPISVEEFNEYRSKWPKPKNVIQEVPQHAKDYALCKYPWNLMMFFVNGTIMHCNRMVQMEGNINFSPLYELNNTPVAQNIRRGLRDDHLDWSCYHCSGCVRSDYEKHLPRAPYYLKRGEAIVFDLDDTRVLRELEYSGISRIQRDGAWNNLRTSKISFYLSEKGDYEMMLEAEAFVIPGIVNEQNVQVKVNGHEVCMLHYDSDKVTQHSFAIKKEWLGQDDLVTLELEYPDAVSPLKLGFGRDDRQRAIFIKKMEIR